MYFGARRVFVAAHGLSLLVASKGYSLVAAAGLSLRRLLLLQGSGSRLRAFSSCRLGALLPRHVGSSQTRDPTRVPCVGRQVLKAPCFPTVPAPLAGGSLE